MTPAPKRRWLQFSLRTFLVVLTAAACWLGYYMNWIQRRAVTGDPQVFNAKYHILKTWDFKGHQIQRFERYSVAPWPLN